jgi:hypothetical protein
MIARASLYLGALAVLATGVAHIEQYSVDNYSTVPTIGTLFLLNFIAAIVIVVGMTRSGAGITNIRDRLAAVGGSLTIASAPAQGTQMLGAIPLSSLASEDRAEESASSGSMFR